MNKQVVKSSPNSTNVQVNGDLSVVINIGGGDIFEALLGIDFSGLPDRTLEQMESNHTSFIKLLIKMLAVRNIKGPECVNDFYSPLFQVLWKQANKIACLGNEESLHRKIALLLIKRLQSPDDELKQRIIQAGLEELEKLTPNHFNILTTVLLITRSEIRSVNTSIVYNADQIIENLAKAVARIVPVTASNIEMEHLRYSRCVIFGPWSTEFSSCLKNQYPSQFANDQDIENAKKHPQFKFLEGRWGEPLKPIRLTAAVIVTGKQIGRAHV